MALGAAPLGVSAAEPTAPVYGLTRWRTYARREADTRVASFGAYQAGVALRLRSVVSHDELWYQVVHDSYRIYPTWPFANGPIYVQPDAIELFDPQVQVPVMPDVSLTEQTLEIDLALPQRVLAWEGSTLVRETLASAGRIFPTPTGHFRIFRKRWARHMQGVDGGVPWDLPGVPYTMYFTGQGHALHGTYWHNAFGSPRSHGCVNLPTSEAEWFFRWVRPEVTTFGDEEYLASGDDSTTQVHVHF